MSVFKPHHLRNFMVRPFLSFQHQSLLTSTIPQGLQPYSVLAVPWPWDAFSLLTDLAHAVACSQEASAPFVYPRSLPFSSNPAQLRAWLSFVWRSISSTQCVPFSMLSRGTLLLPKLCYNHLDFSVTSARLRIPKTQEGLERSRLDPKFCHRQNILCQ